MSRDEHYLKTELYDLVKRDSAIFEFLQSGSLDGIWYWDLEDTAHEWMSPRFWQVFGYDPADKRHLAAEWQDMIHPDDLQVALENFRQHCADPDHPYDQVVRYRHRDGSTVWVRCRGLAVRDDTGKPVRMLGAHTEVTALKNAEDHLRHQAVELRAARDAAEGANRAKSDFLANVSHEIRTPLNGILGTTELLADTDLSSVQRDHLHVIAESAEMLLGIINDILDFSKIEAGHLQLDLRALRLREVVGRALKGLGARLRNRDVELILDLPADVPDHLVGDGGRLRQVLVNLAGNAVKFTERGEVVVRVRVVSTTDAEVDVRFEVADTGIGIAADKQRAIFGEFVQADASTTRRYGGTGLGLAIARRLVTAMGGELGVDSAPGRGSTFFFTARFSRGAPDAPLARLEDLASLRALIVDDNTTNRRILAEMARSWGLRAETAPGVAGALDALGRAARQDDPFRLVLSDVQMPDTDGFGLAAALATRPELGHPVCILLTSGTRAGDEARLRAAGVATCLQKPVTHSELLEAIQGAVARVDPSATPGTRPAPPATHPLRILLADDSVPNQRLAAGMLAKHGHRVTVVSTGAEAVDAWRVDRPDVVVMDLQMPEMDGFEATRAIRAHEREAGAPRTPIVALTARAMPDDEARCRAAGFDGYLAKPFRSADLYDTLRLAAPPAASASTGAVAGSRLDWDSALETVEGDAVLLAKVVEGLLGQYPALVAELRAALDAEDRTTVGRVAHTIAGSLRAFDGATAVAAARTLERICRTGSVEAARDAWRALEAAFDAIRPELERYIEHEGRLS